MSRWYFVIIPGKLALSALILLSCLVFLILSSKWPLGIYALSLNNDPVIYDVMLDPGHGGIDPGAVGPGDLYEKHYVLDIVLRMHEILREQGLKVGLTRQEDRDVSHLIKNGTRHRRDLLGRYKLMNQAALGMSVHANFSKDPAQSGALVFYLKDKYIDEIYAQTVFDELEKVQVMNVKHTVARGTLLLLKAKPPVLLVEVGFMSNAADLGKLVDPEFRAHIAQALCTGILKFVNWRHQEQSEP